jgi:hypothetical protein
MRSLRLQDARKLAPLCAALDKGEPMELTIKGPAFYAQEDEDLFSSCIYGLPNFKQVWGRGLHLDIEFSEPPTDEAIVKLVIICRRWSIDVSPLFKLRRASNQDFSLWEHEA